jgi:hypothetical protein
MKRCFVISPIGAEGTPTREHADDVFDYIIRPAMEECGVTAYRADHVHEPGKISDQMFRAILQDDLAIAVLTGYNPNVFYELAVAQCAGRPVIILLEKGQILPFDIKDLRCVYYDLKPRALFDQVYAKELVAHVGSIAAAGWKGTSPVNGLDLLGEGCPAGPVRCFSRSMDFGSPEAWLKVLKDTERVFEVMGLALRSWKHGKGFGEVLAAKAKAGCRVRVLLCHPENPALRESINPQIPEETFASVVNGIAEMVDYFRAVARACPNVEVRQIRSGCPHLQLTRSDQVAIAIQYLYSESSHYSPLSQYPRGSPLYATMAQEFEALWRGNAEDERAVPDHQLAGAQNH